MEGLPTAKSTCDRTIRGDAYPFLPKLRRTLNTPGSSPLLQMVSGGLSCKSDLVSGSEQSVVMTLTNTTTPSQTGPPCRTVCDGAGCRCHSLHSMQEVDHLTMLAGDQYSSCFCGNFSVCSGLSDQGWVTFCFQKYLPITFSSTNRLRLVYRASHFHFTGDVNNLKFSANYEFIKTRKVNCGKLHFNSTTGKLKL